MGKRAICLVAVLLLAGSAVASAATLGPVGWWKFDETSGATAADSAGKNNGTLLPADPNGKGLGPHWVTGGEFNGAIEFRGGAGGTASDYVQLPIGNLINTLSSATFAVWTNWGGSSGGDWQRIFDFGSGTSIYAFLAANRAGTQSPRFAMRSATVGEQIVTAPATLASGWHHLAVTVDSAAMKLTLFLDGAAVATGATTILPKDMGVTTQNWVARSQYPADSYYKGDVDDLRIYDRALTQDEVANVVGGGLGYGVSNTPVPSDKATDMSRDSVLSWAAGQGAATHDVYFGAVASDVANATTAKPLSVFVSASQKTTTYNPGRLEFGKTYYWRVDEVGPAPGYTVVKGNVWSFTVETFSITVAKANIAATASSSVTGMGPEKTIDGSGLNASDQHSTLETDMWLSAKDANQPTWIRYAFDRAYSLDKMLVWNSNQALESLVGYGAKSVTVEYGADPNKLTKLGVFEFAQASGDPKYTANTTIDFAGAAAKYVKLTITSNWGGVLKQYGLSEVRFSYIPVMARSPSPASGSTNLYPAVTLTWRPGRDAASHDVYLSTDQQAVTNGTVAPVRVTQPTYTPTVELDRTYYWKIVEANAVKSPLGWPSDVWSFSTQQFIRAYTFKNTADRTVTYGTERTFTPVADWTVGGAKTLVMTFRGAPGNTPGHLYIDISGMNGAYWTRVYYSDPWDLSRQVLEQVNIDFSSLSINWKNIQGIKIGVASAGTGTITLDDLRLFRAAPAVVAPVDPAAKGGLAALYAMEGNVNDSAGKGLNGTVAGAPTFVAGQAGFGQALKLDGAKDYVTLPIGDLINTLSDMTVAAWVNWSGVGGIWERIFDFGSSTSVYMFLSPSTNASTFRFAIRTAAVGEQVVEMAPILPTGWHHVAISINSATKVMTLYVDGTPGGTGTTTLLPKDMGVTTQNYLGKSQWPDPLYNGQIDDFRIYNRVLSDGEVRYLAGDR